MDASSFRSTGIKMTIDNPDDFCSFKGKDIDFEDEKYDPFPVYRFKPVAMNMLKHCIVPSRLDNLVANLEYIGSRKMANVEELELAESTLSDKKGRIFNKDGLLFCPPFGRLCFANYCSLNSLDALSSNREGSVDWGPPISRFSLRAHCPQLSNRGFYLPVEDLSDNFYRPRRFRC